MLSLQRFWIRMCSYCSSSTFRLDLWSLFHNVIIHPLYGILSLFSFSRAERIHSWIPAFVRDIHIADKLMASKMISGESLWMRAKHLTFSLDLVSLFAGSKGIRCGASLFVFVTNLVENKDQLLRVLGSGKTANPISVDLFVIQLYYTDTETSQDIILVSFEQTDIVSMLTNALSKPFHSFDYDEGIYRWWIESDLSDFVWSLSSPTSNPIDISFVDLFYRTTFICSLDINTYHNYREETKDGH